MTPHFIEKRTNDLWRLFMQAGIDSTMARALALNVFHLAADIANETLAGHLVTDHPADYALPVSWPDSLTPKEPL